MALHCLLSHTYCVVNVVSLLCQRSVTKELVSLFLKIEESARTPLVLDVDG